MYCNQCGKEIPDGSQFCIHCGASMNTAPIPSKPQKKSSLGKRIMWGLVAVVVAVIARSIGFNVAKNTMSDGSKDTSSRYSITENVKQTESRTNSQFKTLIKQYGVDGVWDTPEFCDGKNYASFIRYNKASECDYVEIIDVFYDKNTDIVSGERYQAFYLLEDFTDEIGTERAQEIDSSLKEAYDSLWISTYGRYYPTENICLANVWIVYLDQGYAREDLYKAGYIDSAAPVYFNNERADYLNNGYAE